ncbi:gliding motility-associated C-terminal domain-containing protein [Cellulophaga baltica]|uniref:Gliding motility-associated C-terminal domain-containing protein n=2 Tax=Cellulophaga baltica TaxID=76594 RepID=A0A1G7JVK4_9FLAO|nr:gliding motility-associated C-terminal domain-containing protein [Cellulophaga baltica]
MNSISSMKKQLLFLLSLLTFSFASYAQLSDLHYLPPLKQGTNNVAIRDQAIYLSTPETTAFTVNAYIGTNTTAVATFNISNLAPATYTLADGDNNITLMTNTNTGIVLSSAGLRFESPGGQEFYVNYRGASGSQATSLTSKGRSALGTSFKWGGMPNYATTSDISTSLGIMATEDNTVIDIFGYDPGCEFRLQNDVDGITSNSIQVTLNAGQSYVLEAYTTETTANIDGWLGASIEATKNIAISNGGLNYGVVASSPGSRDAGIDQPVPENKLGKDYVFIRANGTDATEFALIIATQDNTSIYVNGSTTPIATINEGDYYIIPASYYSGTSAGSNMLVQTSKDAYAYQNMAGGTGVQTIGLNFVAPLNCLLPDVMDNISNITDAAGTSLSGGITIIASTSTPDANIIVNDSNGAVTLPSAQTVAGTADWKTYFIPNLTGNVTVQSTGPIAVGFFGVNSNRGIAGYFSGFDTVPEVVLEINGGVVGDCFSGSTIFEASDDNFDAYQWYFDGEIIEDANDYEFAATAAGDYFLRGTKGPCTYDSQTITIFYCEPEIVINKTVDQAEITEGETATFTIRAENLGFENITNLQVTDNIPSGLTLVSASTITGSWNGSVWNIGTLEPGKPVFLELEVVGDEIEIESLVNIKNTVSHTQDQVDENITEDILSASIIVHNDFDNDGVIDVIDVDDDNDGIYDSDECEGAFCFESITNESFEDPTVSSYAILDENSVPGWFTTATDSKIEIWRSGFLGVDSYDGNQHAELNATRYGALYQNLCLTPGTVMNWSLRHRGRAGTDSMQLRIGADLASATVQQTMTTGNTSWVLYSGSYTVPLGQTNTVFVFEAITTASGISVGNFIDDVDISILVPESCIDSDGDGYPNNIDLDSDDDGCTDADEFYKDNNADADDGGEYGAGIPVVDPDTGAVIAASYVLAQAPKIILENTSEDLGGADINGQEISLGDTFDYVLRFQNTGDDDTTAYTIRNVLPENVTLDDVDVTGATGTTFSHDAVSNEITFTIPDNLVQVGDPEYTIRITVTLSNNCSEFVNACSEVIENLAYSTYQGITNTTTFSDEPGSTITPVCSDAAAIASNSILNDLSNCNTARTVQLCGDDVILSAGNGFTTYVWAIDTNGNGQIDSSETVINDGDPDGDPSTLLVTSVGNYIVEKSGATGCSDLVELITVELFGSTQTNPVIEFFNAVNSDTNTDNDLQGEILTCSIDGSQLPQIFLCGENDEATIQLGITDAESIVWEQLDETSCSGIVDDCATTNSTCTWNTLATDDNYTVTDSGKYRVVINYKNGCFSRFYFNVFKNTLNIDYISSDILCNTPGNIRITNPTSNYGFQLVNALTNNIVIPFSSNNGPNFDLTTSGSYIVQITQLNPTTGEPIENACIFETEEIGIIDKNYEVNITTTPADCSGFGTIAIQALNVLPYYHYELRLDDGTNSGAGTFFQEHVVENDNTYTFDSVPTGNYIVITTTDDGCTDTQNVFVDEYADLTLSASVTENITCNAGLITLTPAGGYANPNYKMAIWSKDGVSAYTDADDIPDSAIKTTTDFLFLDSSAAGEYVFIVIDENKCSTLSNSVTIIDLGPVVVSASHSQIVCADSSTSELTVTASGGTAPYEYSIDGGVTYKTTNVFTNNSAGIYTITVRDSSGSTTSRCTETIEYEIDQPFRLTASAAILEDVACDPLGALVKILNPNGGEAPYTYSFDGGTNYTAIDEQRLISGTYNLSIKDNLGCTYDMELTVPDSVIDPSLNSDVTYDCDGNGTITISSNNTTDFTYSYSLDGTINTPSNSNEFTNVAPGTYQVTVGYSSTISPSQSTLFTENFGTGITTQIGEVGTGYCYEPQDGTATDCNLGPEGILVNGEYAITSAVTNPNTTWRSPNDNTGLTDGRFMAIGVSTLAGNNNIIWSRTGLEVLANKEITVSFYAYNIQIASATGDNPEILVQLVDASGTVISSTATTSIPKNNDADDWHLREVTFNPGANTAVGIVLRTNINSDNGNFLVLDDITASQTPEVCETTQNLSVIVEDDQEFNVTILGSTNPTCSSDSDGNIRFEVENFDSTTGYEYSLDGGTNWIAESTAIFTTPSTLAAGSYSIMVRKTADNTCIATSASSVTLTAPTEIVPDLQLKDAFTCFNTGATLEASASAGTPGYEYQLEDTADSIIRAYQAEVTFTNVPAGDYVLRVRDANGCEVVSTSTVTVVAPEVVDFDLTSVACYDGTNNATITVSVTTGNGDYTFRINNGAWITPTPTSATTHTFTNLANGTYTIDVDDAYSCGPVQKTITVNPQLRGDATLQSDLTCSADAVINMNIVGGSGVYTYEWSNSSTGPWNATGFTANTFSISTAGTYYFQATDNATIPCVFVTNAVVVTTPDTPIITSVTPTDLTCNGDNTGSLDIIIDTTVGLAPYTINVLNTTTGTDYLEETTSLTAGTYTVRVTDSKNCFIEQTVTINEPLIVDPNITKTDVVCGALGTDLGSITVDASGGNATYIYRLNNADFSVSETYDTSSGTNNYTFSDLDFGDYKVTVTDINGCEIVTDITITTGPDILITTSGTSGCTMGSGEMLVEADNSTGATLGTGPFYFAIFPAPDFDITDTTNWHASTTTSPALPSYNFTGLTPGVSYTFIVHDASSGCEYYQEADVPVATSSTLTSTIDAVTAITCFGSADGIVAFTIDSYTATTVDYEIYSYATNTSLGITGNITGAAGGPETEIVMSLPPGKFYILFTEIDGTNAGCVNASETFIVEQAPTLLEVTATATKNANCNESGTITAAGRYGEGPYEYQYLSDVAPAPTATSAGWETSTTKSVSAGDYIVYIKDASNCIQQDAVTIGFHSAPDIDTVVVDDFCADEGDYSVTVTLVTPDTAAYLISLNGGAPQTSNFVNGEFVVTGLSSSASMQSISVFDVNGCGDFDTFEIAARFQASAQITKLLDCSLSPNSEITIAAFDGYGTFDYEINGPDSQTRTALPSPTNSVVWDNATTPGTYTITIYDNTTPACSSKTFTLEIVPAVEPSFTATHEAVTCSGNSDGIIAITEVNTGISPSTYTISPAAVTFNSTTNSFEGLPGGTYEVTATGTNGCTTIISNIVIDEPLLIAFSLTESQFGCSANNTTNNAELSVDPTSLAGGSGTYVRYLFADDTTGNILQNGTSNTYIYTNLNGGDIRVTVFDDKGCSSSQVITIDPFDALEDATITVDENIDCVNAGEDISINVTGTYSTYATNPTDYEFRLLPATTYQASNNFTDLGVGTHTIGIRNIITGCEITRTHTVEQPNTFDVTVDVLSDVVCFGDDGSIQLTLVDATFAGGFTWTIYNASSTAIDNGTSADLGPTTAIPVPAGNYTVTIIQDAFPECSQTRSFTITTPPAAITLNAVQTSNVGCSNGEGSANVSPAGGKTLYDIVLTNTTTGSVYTELQVNAHLFDGLEAGIYDVQVTDDLGCVQTFSSEFTLVEPTPLTGTITNTELECSGDTDASVSFVLDPRNVTPNYSYSLNTYSDATGSTLLRNSVSQTSPDFNNLVSGFYSITITDDINCEFETAIVEIVEPTDVDALLITDRAISCLDGADLLLVASGGTAPYTWSEDGINFNPLNETNGTDTHLFENMPVGIYKYYVKDDFNCVSIISNTLTVNAIADLVVNLDTSAAKINCSGDSTAVLIADAEGGLGSYQYALFSDAALTTEIRANQSSGIFTDLASGTYYVRVQSRDCEIVSIPVIIDEPTPITVDYDISEITCNGENDGSIVLNLTGGSGVYMYSISPNLNRFESTNTFDGLAPGDYTVIAQDSLGCFELIEFTLVEPAELTMTSTVQDEICLDSSDGSISLAIAGGIAPYFTSINATDDAAFVQDRTLFENLSAGTYTVYVKDTNDCLTTEIITVEVGVNLNATAEVLYECTGDTPNTSLILTLEDQTVGNDVLYALDSTDPADFVLEPDFTNMTAGSHYVAIAHANGCIRTFNFEVEGYEPLVLVAEQRGINEITAIAKGGKEEYTYYFDGIDNGNDNTFYIRRTDTYEVRVVDENGCESVTSIYIEFIDIEIPNFFTPDGDGTNDLWIPDNITQFPDIYITIYDRYGREVYRLIDNPSGWDGLYKNTDLPTGDYWYIIKLNGADDDREFVGHFTLYR